MDCFDRLSLTEDKMLKQVQHDVKGFDDFDFSFFIFHYSLFLFAHLLIGLLLRHGISA
jgi:hypothetical protein